MSERHAEPPPEDPTVRTGAEDPFEPIDPDDPLGIRVPDDPYLPADPDPDPTLKGGILPPPPAPPIGPTEPPGRVSLRAAMQRFAGRKSTLSKAGEEVQKQLERIVLPGRNQLGDHWTAVVGVLVANERARIATGSTPDFDRIDRLANVIATHNEFGDALNRWCVARDAVPPDEAALAASLSQATDSLNRLQAGFVGNGFDPDNINTSLEVQVQSIYLLAEANLKRINEEAATVMSGARVPRSEPSEGMVAVVLMGGADQNFQDRFSRANTWKAAGTALANAIGSETLKTPVARASGTIDLTRATRELAALDASLKARKRAADPTDATIQSAVYNDYLAVIDAHTELLQKVRAAAASGRNGKGEWTPAKVREVTDMLVGMLRCAKAYLADDPLVQDPAFATRTRNMVEQIDALAGLTSLEVDSQALGADLRKVWKDAKTKELATLKKARVDTAKLSSVFDGLGPTLDTWAAEVAKFPRHNRDTVKNLTAQLAATLSSYRSAVEATAGPTRSSNLVHALDTVASAMARQLRSFDARGGLF